MIIFDLDGTLADCSHRRHFVDPSKHPDWVELGNRKIKNYVHIDDRTYRKKFIPDWKAFYEACDHDKIIKPTKSILIQYCHRDIEIWSGRCESVRNKTEKWISEKIFDSDFRNFKKIKLKMRPIGDYTPDEQLKERWLDEHLASGGKPIEFIFDDRPKVVRMWRRRGIFVFDCNQSGEEF